MATEYVDLDLATRGPNPHNHNVASQRQWSVNRIPSSLGPEKTRLAKHICSFRATSFVLLIVSNITTLLVGAAAQAMIAEKLGPAGLDKMRNPLVYGPCLISFWSLSLLSGYLIYLQMPFLIVVPLMCGMIFHFWVACLITVAMVLSALFGIYMFAKFRYKSAFEERVNEEDPIALSLKALFETRPIRWLWLSMCILSLIPSQILVLIIAVIEKSVWKSVVVITLAACTSIIPTFIGHCLAIASRDTSASPNLMKTPLYLVILQTGVTVTFALCLIIGYFFFKKSMYQIEDRSSSPPDPEMELEASPDHYMSPRQSTSSASIFVVPNRR